MALKKKGEEAPQTSNDVSMDDLDSGLVSTELVEKTLECVRRVFGVGREYILSEFKKKGQSITISLASVDYDLTVTIKDTLRSGLVDPEG